MTENEELLNIKKHIHGHIRAWGTSSIFRNDTLNAIDMAIQALEKQISKKPILCMNETTGMFVDYADGQGEYKTQMNNWWKCPCCNSVVGQRVVLQDHVHDQKKKKFCENCGQKLDFGEE